MDRSFAQLKDSHRRRAILKLLAEDVDYAINDSLMQAGLDAVGHGVSRDRVLADFNWLAEQGLVTEQVVDPTMTVAKITQRGLDVARGHAIVTGVERPRPGE